MERPSILFALLVVYFILISPIQVQAQKTNNQNGNQVEALQIQYEKINPSDGFDYGLKRFKEKLYLGLLFYSKDLKTDYYNKLVTRRLAELKYIVENKDIANFENATTRYFTTVGQFTSFLVKNVSAEQKSKVAENLFSHIIVLEDLRDVFEGQEKAEWRFMQDDINYTKIYINQLRE